MLALEERGAVERTAELLGDRVEQALLGRGEGASLLESDTEAPDAP